ncbi:MAG TPA: polysaccharide deacetylase family protein [Anaerolineales bacterium]|nr:polysaccharide deacetylase family protein [Anaerolineales bacterium]
MSTLSRRDFLKLGGAVLFSAALGGFNDQGAPPSPPPIVYHGSRDHRYIALTFDDCWHPEVLEQLNEMVAPYPDFHFTFFAVGDALQINEVKDPGVWRRLIGRGHEIGYHTMHHYDPVTMSSKSLIADFDQWSDMLHQVLGFEPPVRFAKPPYDDMSPSFQLLCDARDLVLTMYSIGYEGQTVDDGLRAAAQTQNGDIAQMHTYEDPNKGRLDASISAKVIPYLADQGFGLVTMSKLYDDLLLEQNSSAGCAVGTGASLTRTCLE